MQRFQNMERYIRPVLIHVLYQTIFNSPPAQPVEQWFRMDLMYLILIIKCILFLSNYQQQKMMIFFKYSKIYVEYKNVSTKWINIFHT